MGQQWRRWLIGGLTLGLGIGFLACTEEVDLLDEFQSSLAGVAITTVEPVQSEEGVVSLELAVLDEEGSSEVDFASEARVRVYERSLVTGERVLVYDSALVEEEEEEQVLPANAAPAAPSLNAPKKPKAPKKAPRGLNLAMVLDRSGSMNQNEQLAMEAAALAVLNFLNLIPIGQHFVEVINVSTAVHVDADVRPPNNPQLEQAITNPSIRHGWTKIFDAILQGAQDAANHKKNQVNKGTQRIAVFTVTDGEDNRSDATVPDVVDFCVDINCPVFIIGIADPSDPTDLQESDLQQIADGTGGRLILTTNPTALTTILTALQNAVTNPYVIEYESPFPDEDREVEVELELDGETYRNRRRVGNAV